MVVGMEPEGDLFESCFQKTPETPKVRLDCARACELHVSSRHGTPKVVQNDIQNTLRFQDCLFQAKYESHKTLFQKKIQMGEGIPG